MPPGGKRAGAGRKPKPKIDAAPLTKGLAAELYDDPITKIRWQELRDVADMSLRFQVEKEIAHQSGHKPVQTVNHLHDKPVEVNHHFDLAELISKGRARLK